MTSQCHFGTTRLTCEQKIGIERFHTLESFLNVLRVNHVIEPFTERSRWPLHRFYLNKFYSNIVQNLNYVPCKVKTFTIIEV